MSNNFYNSSGYPATDADGDSQSARSEFANIAAGFDKLPTLTGNGLKMVRVNATGTGLEAVALTGTLVSNTPAGTIASTTVQAAINEIDGDVVALSGSLATYAARTVESIGWTGSDIVVVAPAIHAAPNKTSLVDADEIGFWNSVGSVLGHITWANVKTSLQSFFVRITAVTGSAAIPTRTTTQRDAADPSPAVGLFGYNTSTNQFEGYGANGWGKVGGGATGAGTDAVFYENDHIITGDYTIGQDTMVSGITITSANPGVVTWPNHGHTAGQMVFWKTTGALPTNIPVDWGLYVLAAGLTTDNFRLSLTDGGAAIDTTAGTQSGVHSCGKIKHAHVAGNITVNGSITIPTGSSLVNS